ncbi:MAG: copper amine oxidase N-terminal domain-containing protein [Firmicutes bacterium]|nr:copper amine oxidase N-terminal domain-containing protein [Bacillota bacterium]
MKRKIAGLILTGMFTAALCTSAFAANVYILIDGKEVESDTEPQITAEGRTIVPLRVISENLGGDVDWDGEEKVVTVKKDDKKLVLKIGENVMDNNGTELKLDSPAVIINSRTMVPLRAISESFGCNVDWDGETKTVLIETQDSEPSYEVYNSDYGWSTRYNSKNTAVNKSASGTSFVYTGESSGTNMVTISVIKNKQPEEVLTEKISDWEENSYDRYEGYVFGGKWGFHAMTKPVADSSGLVTGYTAAEYNDGVILIEVIQHISGNDDIDITVSDVLSSVVNSLEFDEYQTQKEYEYVPGTYVRKYTDEIGGEKVEKTETVKLYEDHNGVVDFQDKIDIYWTTKELVNSDNNGESYEYTIEGDTLYVKIGNDWVEFKREGTETEKDEKPSAYEEAEKLYSSVISKLKKGQAYAFADLQEENDVLLVADGTFDNGNDVYASIEATVYGVDEDGNVKEFGKVSSSSTATPLAVLNKRIYTQTHKSIEKSYLDAQKAEILLDEGVYLTFAEDDTITYSYKNAEGEKTLPDDTEFTHFMDEYGKATVVSFKAVE